MAPSERACAEVARSGETKQPEKQRAADEQLGAHLELT